MKAKTAQTLRQRMEAELRGDILPWWMEHAIDLENGGFIGALTNDLQANNEEVRSLVLCARMLWTYSLAFQQYGDPAYRQMADHAYTYLTGPFLDREHGGMFWWLNRQGKPVNDRKQTYGQAFAIYGLSEYYRATGNLEAMDLAQQLFAHLEAHAADPIHGGYVEGCARDWTALADMRLSEKEPFNCPKSMNTLLHVIEGYTGLMRSWTHPQLEAALANLLKVFMDHVIDPRTHFTRLFFEMDWTSLSETISYGHDIETSWLLVEAAEVLGDEALLERARANAVQMAEAVLAQGLDTDGSVFHEGEPGAITDPSKHWWCQAEGIVGFYNAHQISGDEKFLRAAMRIWDFIEAYMIDRTYGEWFKILDERNQPLPGQVKAGPWEDPYHHARACMEIVRRVR